MLVVRAALVSIGEDVVCGGDLAELILGAAFVWVMLPAVMERVWMGDNVLTPVLRSAWESTREKQSVKAHAHKKAFETQKSNERNRLAVGESCGQTLRLSLLTCAPRLPRRWVVRSIRSPEP
jgi:hypothetical protein